MNSSSAINCAIPGEYREVAETLFPAGWFSMEKGAELAAADNFAKALGIDAEYQRLLGVGKDTGQIREFLGHFQNNLDLLIQKTWVEKSDEARKEKLQDQIPPLLALIVQENYQQAIKEFGIILDELAYLFFGAQSSKDDFAEYAFRIDDQIGLFWWYGSQLGSLKGNNKDSPLSCGFLWAVLLLGICYLTNF
ncbi:MAG: hypothetical protein LBI06_03665 [Treponema sp.]|jgi:hypothetical protein|nr:hypothetical protein [Treponema sp.]